MKKIWLIRHGESEANAGMKSSNPAEIPLSPAGIEQARKLTAKFEKAPDFIAVSPFLRTKQTAAPLLEKYPAVVNEEWEIQEFTYIAPRRCKNSTLSDRTPMVEDYWKRGDPDYCDGGGAESFIDFMRRAQNTIEKLNKKKEEFIVLFSHGQFISAVSWILGKDKVSVREMAVFKKFHDNKQMANCEIREIKF